MTNWEKFINESKIIIKGDSPGKKVTIFVGVHGNEKVGIEAVKKIMPDLKLRKGVLQIVLANPRATEKNVRYVDENLNRLFFDKKANNTYESKRVVDLIKILDESDALLDIHSSNSKKTIPFLITEKNALHYAKYFPFSIISYGWDSIEPGGADGYMNKKNKIGITLECGSSYNHDEFIDMAVESIFIFLDLFGLQDYNKVIKKNKQKYLLVTKAVIKKTENFHFKESLNDFDELLEGRVYAVDGTQEFIGKKGQYIIFPREDKQVGEEVFILGEEALIDLDK